MKAIARIHNDVKGKFGLPRQSGLAPSLLSRIVFEPEFRNADALRGLEGFSHIWLIWDFSESHTEEWSPTVRPPRLGGNKRMGVFATRSPFRPNPIGLSCVRLEAIDLDTPEGPVLTVSGADLMDGTPIFDIKPYLPGADSRPDARDGFVGEHRQKLLEVESPEKAVAADLEQRLDSRQMTALREILAQDPRPAYHDDPDRIYTLTYAGLEIKFRADATTATVTGFE
ncbi:MAG: tRNA (N6-threonylcarbamoyladenosine(37)-N6)-methyltransferase TrmO [Bacteroidales bacterium]|nr:tRNA (N6-threonylcarbamoyladenosine(37)-N6)-methyltransferase TrmO [Bacteroidales bacterium]